jgi:hypothetical protein
MGSSIDYVRGTGFVIRGSCTCDKTLLALAPSPEGEGGAQRRVRGRGAVKCKRLELLYYEL